MGQIRGTQALRFLRKMRGGSQPILIDAGDGCQYVVKFPSNPQGPNVLFNEVAGTELYRQFGLPVPEWRLVYVSEGFLRAHPDSWRETPKGRQMPEPGWCFGSRYLGMKDAGIYEILPRSQFSRIENRQDFWKAWVLDILCEHADNRQAVFLRGNLSRTHAFFVDHGHVLGGAHGEISPIFWASRYLDPEIYIEPEAQAADELTKAWRALDLEGLSRLLGELPSAWRTPSGLSRFERVGERVSDPAELQCVIDCLQGHCRGVRRGYDGPFAKPGIGLRRKHLCA